MSPMDNPLSLQLVPCLLPGGSAEHTALLYTVNSLTFTVIIIVHYCLYVALYN